MLKTQNLPLSDLKNTFYAKRLNVQSRKMSTINFNIENKFKDYKNHKKHPLKE